MRFSVKGKIFFGVIDIEKKKFLNVTVKPESEIKFAGVIYSLKITITLSIDLLIIKMNINGCRIYHTFICSTIAFCMQKCIPPNWYRSSQESRFLSPSLEF